jgi:small subunit ribosomal protein S20
MTFKEAARATLNPLRPLTPPYGLTISCLDGGEGFRRRLLCRTDSMANTTSAKKAARKIARRAIVNKARRSRMRGVVRTVEEAIASGDPKAASTALKAAEPAIMRAAQNGVMHKNTASRKVSRLTHQIAKLGK